MKIQRTERHKLQKPMHAMKVQAINSDNCNEFSHVDPPEIWAVLSEGENFSYVRLKFSLKRNGEP